MIVTRFAPTCSGDLHIGSLYNALLNYLYAKKHGGLFKLRLDRIVLDENERNYQRNIEKDLRAFGLIPDETLKSSDRLETYMKIVDKLKKHERSYHCDCVVQDLLKRANENDSKFYHLYRPEKYPPYCKIAQIQVFNVESESAISGCGIFANHEAEGHRASCLLARQPQKSKWWEPHDVGYMYHDTGHVSLRIDLPPGQVVRAVKIVWKDRPVLHYRIYADQLLVEVKKHGRHFVEHKQGHPFLPLQYDVHNFAPRKMPSIFIDILDCAHPVDKPYFYDNHCRKEGKDLDLNHKHATLRLEADTAFSKYDVAYYYDRQPNLVLTSVVDDAELKITDCIRGEDIHPWLDLEGQVALALQTPPRNQRFHGLVIDNVGYKYSKWIESTPIREYNIEPDRLIAYLANKAGIVKKEVKTLKEAVKEYNGEIPSRHIVVDEREMLNGQHTNN